MENVKPIRDAQTFRAYDVTLDQARKLCEVHRVETPLGIRRIKRGEVNAVFKLWFDGREDLILKVGVRSLLGERLNRECTVMKYLHGSGQIPVPEIVGMSEASDDLPYPHALMSWVDGEDGDVLWQKLDEGQRFRVIENCGFILKQLHAVELPEMLEGNLGKYLKTEDWCQKETREFKDAVKILYDQDWMKQAYIRQFEAVWEKHQECLASLTSFGLVHHDFQLHNLKIDPDTLQVVALLDWDNVALSPCLTDARDLELNMFLAQPQLRHTFWTAYGVSLTNDLAIGLKLHMLKRALELFAAYWGPAPNGVRLEQVLQMVAMMGG